MIFIRKIVKLQYMATKKDREIYSNMDFLDENVQDSSMDVHSFF